MTDTDHDLEISEEAPTDDEGHPIHPDSDKDHRICGATKSDRTTPTDHGRERDDVEFCTLAAGWGVDGASEGACKHHLGAVDNRGSNNPNYKHGAYAESFIADFLTDEEVERVKQSRELLGTPEGAQDDARLMASIVKEQYRRSGDERFLRRYESICDKAGIFPGDELTVNHEGLEDAFMSNLREYHEDE